MVQIGQGRAKGRPPRRVVTGAIAGEWHIEPGNGHGRHLAFEQAEKQLSERLFALTDDGEVIIWCLQHPGVVRRDLRAAENQAHLGQTPLHLAGNPQRALDVPDIAGKPNHPWPALDDRRDQRTVPQRVRGRCRQEVDAV